MALSLTVQSRLEKAAVDNRFDLQLEASPEWLTFRSSHCELQIWLSASSKVRDTGSHGFAPGLILALSRIDIATQLGESAFSPQLPQGAISAVTSLDFELLGAQVRRAFQLARALPNALAIEHAAETANMPRSTEVERLVIQRIGQNIFRQGLLAYWDARCCVTELDVVEVLRASHMKPWARCETDAERLNIHNGLLLAPHLDALFDGGFISFTENGEIRISRDLSHVAQTQLMLSTSMKLRTLNAAHKPFLAWHLQHIWRK